MRCQSRLRRFIAAATAVTTILSLGCAGLEPMLSALYSHDHSGMTCAGDNMSGTNSIGTHGIVVPAPEHTGEATHYMCACQSCGTATVAVSLPHAAGIAPESLGGAVAVELVGIATRPPLPPPERLA